MAIIGFCKVLYIIMKEFSQLFTSDFLSWRNHFFYENTPLYMNTHKSLYNL